MNPPATNENQEAINGYIHQIRHKLECLAYGFRETNWDNLIHSKEETRKRLADLERHLHAAIQLLPVERGAKNATN